ncbi:signal transduction histidine kinase [Crossiella equi]|uniref:Signal transduction histidine kinase n=1 Tax=Crossiella equi TaxID=130796 RepID=A0ABS5A875_9PSEU|nr:ATP-binding protein [Crossiella equi]MBP2472798.1 signal transduction histidine kinase [Crossiella equi]
MKSGDGQRRKPLFKWLDPRFMLAEKGQQRTRWFITVILFCQRVSYLLPASAHLLSSDLTRHASPALNSALLGLAWLWTGYLAFQVRRRGWFSERQVVIDVVFACVLIAVVTANVQEGFQFTTVNWAPKYALGTAALIGAVLPIRVAALVSVAPLAVYVLELGRHTTEEQPLLPAVVGHVNSAIFFFLILYFMTKYLTAQAEYLDEQTEARLRAETREAAERARYETRTRHYRALHDNALATLTAIAMGGLDHRSEQVRARCAKDAEYVRRLIVADTTNAFTGLGDRLAEVVTDAEALGLRVRYVPDTVPGHLPHHVVEAVADASREALNNVAKHAGVQQAWLTVSWVEDTLGVRVVDRGKGFDPVTTPRGQGLTSSISGRMREIGGSVEIDSVAGEGTCVELLWSPNGEV